MRHNVSQCVTHVTCVALLARQAGGPDYFMSGTCLVFLVAGPILRPLTQLWLMWVHMSLETQKGLHRASRHISVFYAFEARRATNRHVTVM